MGRLLERLLVAFQGFPVRDSREDEVEFVYVIHLGSCTCIHCWER